MNTKHLELFCKVVDVGSVTEAARQLHVSQPAVSMQLRRIEEEQGVVLFHTSGKGTTLTDAGQAFYDYAVRMLAVERQLQREMDEYRSGQKGSITLGTTDSVGTYLLPARIDTFLTQHPEVSVTVLYMEDSHLESAVRDGRLDVAVSFSHPTDHVSLRVTKLCDAAFKPIHTCKENSRSQWFAARDCVSFIPYEYRSGLEFVPSQETVVQYVRAGLGAGWVLDAPSLVADDLQSHASLERASVTVHVFTRPAERISRSLRYLLSTFASTRHI